MSSKLAAREVSGVVNFGLYELGDLERHSQLHHHTLRTPILTSIHPRDSRINTIWIGLLQAVMVIGRVEKSLY